MAPGARHGEDWEEKFLPQATVRNLAKLLALTVLRCQTVADVCCPRAFAEKICEHHFSKVKRPFAGVPSIRDSILSTQRLHFEQLRVGDLPEPSQTQARVLSSAEIKTLAEQALDRACKFLAWISTHMKPHEVEQVLGLWFKTTGMKFLSRRAREADDENEFDVEDDVGIED